MGVLDWFRRRKSKIEEPLQAAEQIPKETKGEAKPRAKEARVEEKTRRKSGKRRKKSV